MPATHPPSTTAADLMTASPRTCSKFSTVLEAVLIFRDADCGAVPVLDEGKPIGVLTDRDVALALADYEDGLAGLPVTKLMSQGVVSVTPETPLDVLVERFGEKGVRRLLVIDPAGLLIGIIGLSDLAPRTSDRAIGQVVTEVVDHP